MNNNVGSSHEDGFVLVESPAAKLANHDPWAITAPAAMSDPDPVPESAPGPVGVPIEDFWL